MIEPVAASGLLCVSPLPETTERTAVSLGSNDRSVRQCGNSALAVPIKVCSLTMLAGVGVFAPLGFVDHSPTPTIR